MLGLVLGNLSIPGCSLYAANHLNLSKRRNSLDRLGFFLFQEGIYEDLANKAGFVDYSVSWPRRGKPVNTCNFETPFKKDCYYIPSKFVLPARIWAVCKSGFFFKDASMPRAFEKSRRARWGSHLMFENKYRPLLTKDTWEAGASRVYRYFLQEMQCHGLPRIGGGGTGPWLLKRIEIPRAIFSRLSGAAGLKLAMGISILGGPASTWPREYARTLARGRGGSK